MSNVSAKIDPEQPTRASGVKSLTRLGISTADRAETGRPATIRLPGKPDRQLLHRLESAARLKPRLIACFPRPGQTISSTSRVGSAGNAACGSA